jgi:hypothetical protein
MKYLSSHPVLSLLLTNTLGNMSNYRLLLENVELSDAEAVKSLQKKLNQWKTQGILLKFSIDTAGSYALFTIALRTQPKTVEPEPVIETVEEDDAPF